MSGFGFSGFGQNNNTQQNTGFGGFGSTTPAATGFGTSNNTGGFGSNPTTTGNTLFGGGGAATGTGFGSGTAGGFGGFGAKPATPAFGATNTANTGAGIFGSGGSNTSAFGGFGSNTTPTPAFGAANTSAGSNLFGAKPATSAFGSGNTTSSPFGGASNTNAFGGSSGSAFGASQATAVAGTIGECPGTGVTPFSAHVEKEPNATGNNQVAYQSIVFQQPYQKFSPEELRLVDYQQGRRFGNSNQQAGAFGAATNFGGFGNTSNNATGGFGANTGASTGTTSLFGGSNNASTGGFGQQPATNAFGGSNNTSTLFGQKPATAGFGATTTPSNNLFGGTNTGSGFGATAGGFGSNNTPANNLFGATNNDPKPATGFGFGTQQSNTTPGFGASNTAGGLFGGSLNTNTGTNNTTPANNLFGFGGNNNQQQNNTTQPLFGAPKPATTSLFGGTPATSTPGLFGGTSTPAATGFGTSTSGGGLFGATKPAPASGLFAPTNNTNTTAPSLFSGLGQNNQQQQTSNLFGGAQQKPGGLFGQTQQNTTSNLFGGSTNTNTNSLFGGQNNQQQQQPAQATSSLFGGTNSLLGNSQQSSQPQSLTASLNDNAAFGTASLFQNLGSTQVNNPGPIATPLSSVSKPKKSAQVPIYRLLPASSSHFSTPSKRGPSGGYGLSYSTSSSAASSSSAPYNFNQSLLGNSLNHNLAKSISGSSLRRQFSSEDSVLAPNAFSGSPSSRHMVGNVKKLVINKNVKNDLFTPPRELRENGQSSKKNVRFNEHTVGANPSPLKNHQSDSSAPSPQELGLLRSSTNGSNGTNNNGTNGTNSAPEMQQVRGDEVAVRNEENTQSPALPKTTNPESSGRDQPLGEYWSRPSIEELAKMNPKQLEKIKDFEAGRVGAGQVLFHGEVSLAGIPIDKILGGVISFTKRSLTVYGGSSPPVGQGLNVHSTVTLHQVWPKNQKTSHAKHVSKLKKIENTKFVTWNPDTGDWTFTVDHYTTYEFDDDDDEEDAMETDAEPMDSTVDFGNSTLSAPPDTPTPRRQTPRGRTPREDYQEDSYLSQLTATDTNTDSNIDDTFEFRTKKNLPGAFDNRGLYEEDEEMDGEYLNEDQSFLDRRSVGSQSEFGVEDSTMQETGYDDESVISGGRDVADSFYSDDNTTGQGEFHVPDADTDMKLLVPDTPALMRARLREKNTPLKTDITAGDDWMKSLQGSISPRKQDRRMLKQRLASGLDEVDEDEEGTPVAKRSTTGGPGIATSIDLMNSLFGHAKSPQKQIRSPKKTPKKPQGFARPYSKVPSAVDEGSMDELDRAFHYSVKPSWGPDGLLVYAAQPDASTFGKSGRAIREKDGLLEIQGIYSFAETQDIRFAKFSYQDSVKSIQTQKSVTTITTENDIPYAEISSPFKFIQFSDNIPHNPANPAAEQEKLVWELAAALFDPIAIPKSLEDIPNIASRLRKELVSDFWQKRVDKNSNRNADMAKTSEEKAIACLSGHKIIEACNYLVAGENFHLATLVALLGNRSEATRLDIQDQLKIWNTKLMLPEIDAPIRAIYEILAGNVCECSGKETGPIEDWFKPFVISNKFGLDWRQAFGLRLWYAISAEQPLQDAVNMFAADLSENRELQKPIPWYVERNMQQLWLDAERNDREDVLWGLLKLFSNPQTADLQSILRPENSQLSPLDVRLSWQLGRALIATGSFTYGSEAEDKENALTLSFANQLTAQGDWLDATFVLLHLSDHNVREKAIRDHISRHAGRIGDETDAEFHTLTKEFKIPSSWVWEAKALYMRSVKKNPQREVEYLLKARSWVSAHSVFSSEVAPVAVIERDHDVLKKLLRGFVGKETRIEGWHLGGELYSDYIALVEGQKTNPNHPDPKIIDRLLAALPAVADQRSTMMETVAIQEIGGVVAKIVLASQSMKRNRSKILRLPLTEDKCLQHTVDLALSYYRTAMAVAN